MSRVDDESNDDFVVHKQSGTGLTCMLSRLLNILGGGGHIRSRCGVDWLHSKPELIYLYL